MIRPTADVAAAGDQTAIAGVVRPAAYVTGGEVMAVHAVERCIGRSRAGQLQDTCALVFTGGWVGLSKLPQGQQGGGKECRKAKIL